ncbi:MAG: hypothetical protein HXX11_06575 [Desulfuromonadales bacterium]|nr:hypothetical protein [Desulfuromonadales bacterium]
MLAKISKEEANVLAAYEPIESEFRTHACKKWSHEKVGICLFGPTRRSLETEAKVLTMTINSYREIGDRDMAFDYFPLD